MFLTIMMIIFYDMIILCSNRKQKTPTPQTAGTKRLTESLTKQPKGKKTSSTKCASNFFSLSFFLIIKKLY